MAHLSPRVLKQLTRLKGRIPADFAPVELSADTPVGPRAIPPSVQALLAVVWPAKHVLLTKDEFHWEVSLPMSCEAEPGMIREDRAWHVVGYDDGQYYTVVDLDEAAGTDDPLTYHVDHEGDEPVPWGLPLSKCLAGYMVKRPPAAKYAFIRACAAGDLDAVREGLAAANLGPVNSTGIAPLHMAVLTGRSVELVEALLEAGADVGAAITRDIPSMHTFAEKERLFGRILHVGDTALHAAVSGLEHWADRTAPIGAELVRVLLEAGADPNARNRYGRAPLILVAAESRPRHLDAVRLLLAAGADPELGDADDTPLRRAASSASAEIVAALLAAGADPCRATGTKQWGVDGVTPLHSAAFRGTEETLRLLLDAAGDVDVRTAGGVTPLHCAAGGTGAERVRALLEAGADPTAVLPDPKVFGDDATARTPLEIARHAGRSEIVAVLEGAGG